MDTTPTTDRRLIAAHALAETIREVGECPAGLLYAPLCGILSASQFNDLIAILVRAGLVRRDPSHLLTWTGPKN